MNTFTFIFLGTLAFCVALRIWLGALQIAHLGAHRADVPLAFRTLLPRKLHAKATDYTIAKTRLEIASVCLEAVILLLWILGGGLDLLDRAWRGLGLPFPIAGAAVIVSSLLLLEGLRLPVAACRLFVVEQRFGFNRVTPALFLADVARKGGLLIAASLPLAVLAQWLMAAAAGYRWFAIWGLWALFQLAMVWGYPKLVSPLFNRSVPLPEGDVKARVAELMARSGYALDEVMVMDGSRRSSHANAHVTGVGSAKRVVLLDTLAETLEPAEIEAVTAHELGHLAHRHIVKYHAARAGIALAWILAFGWLAEQPGFLPGLGLSLPSPHAALALMLAISPLFSLLVRPAMCFMARRFEFQADAYVARHSNPGSLCRALMRLSRRNVSPLSAHPLYAAFFQSHPSLPARIDKLTPASEAHPAQAGNGY